MNCHGLNFSLFLDYWHPIENIDRRIRGGAGAIAAGLRPAGGIAEIGLSVVR